MFNMVIIKTPSFKHFRKNGRFFFQGELSDDLLDEIVYSLEPDYFLNKKNAESEIFYRQVRRCCMLLRKQAQHEDYVQEQKELEASLNFHRNIRVLICHVLVMMFLFLLYKVIF